MTGYVFIASGRAITWKSTESKYITLSKSGKEAVWLQNLFQELGFIQPSPTIIKGNNYGSVKLSHNSQFHDLHYHWI